MRAWPEILPVKLTTCWPSKTSLRLEPLDVSSGARLSFDIPVLVLYAPCTVNERSLPFSRVTTAFPVTLFLASVTRSVRVSVQEPVPNSARTLAQDASICPDSLAEPNPCAEAEAL